MHASTSLPQQPFAVLATAYHADSPASLIVLSDTLICVDAQGTIEAVLRPDDVNYQTRMGEYQRLGRLVELEQGQYLLPGFVDLHVHAPQWPQTGKALHLPLYEWLQDNTFPLEARYADLEFARQVYTSLVETLLANGTTTAMYFATLHDRSSLALAEICLEKGQRALVGRVTMDDAEQCPDFYRDDSAQEAIAATAAFIDAVQTMTGNEHRLVHPVITPRFIPSCSDALLTGLGELARRTGCHVQTHCSESDWEHSYVRQRCQKNDAQALNDFGLLTRKTILAHANFLSDEDMATLHATGAGVAHCPLSNFYFANSVFPLRHALDQSLHVGLATDISGGHSPSMFDSCRHAITASCALQDGVNPALPPEQRGRENSKISFLQAFWLATAGGGQVLDLPVGQFKVGYHFDALLIDTQTADSNITLWPDLDRPDDVLQKILYNATRANVARTWIQGQTVYTQSTRR